MRDAGQPRMCVGDTRIKRGQRSGFDRNARARGNLLEFLRISLPRLLRACSVVKVSIKRPRNDAVRLRTVAQMQDLATSALCTDTLGHRSQRVASLAMARSL